ncbi:MAG: RelA/SpoT domain-containing protein [Pseudomonadota bacterium]
MIQQPALTSTLLRQHVDDFIKVRDSYVIYARVLQRLLENACRTSFPTALVQTRAKTVSSFAEKVARKFDKNPDPVNQFTDLCGARVIVQTNDQVRGVREFIESNFTIIKADNKEVLLGSDRFGYRDMHYIVQLHPDHDALLGIQPEERLAIGERNAEIQVRTWIQHAWADTLHDRIYKARIKASSDETRTANLLAALLEESDKGLCHLATHLDGIIANYTAHASKTEVAKEIEIQALLLGNERDEDKKPGLALALAKLHAASGENRAVVTLLEPHKESPVAIRPALLLQLWSEPVRGASRCTVQPGLHSGKAVSGRGTEAL